MVNNGGSFSRDQRAPEFRAVRDTIPVGSVGSAGSVGAVNRPHAWGEYTCHFVILDEPMEVRTRARNS